jgi:uncharacterized OsmC-like protein
VTLSSGNNGESPERVQFLKEQVELRCPIAAVLKDAGVKKDIQWEVTRS